MQIGQASFCAIGDDRHKVVRPRTYNNATAVVTVVVAIVLVVLLVVLLLVVVVTASKLIARVPILAAIARS